MGNVFFNMLLHKKNEQNLIIESLLLLHYLNLIYFQLISNESSTGRTSSSIAKQSTQKLEGKPTTFSFNLLTL